MMLETLILSISVLATFANITVPVIPDPEYLRSLDLPDRAPFIQQNSPTAVPTQITDYIPYLISGGIAYFMHKEKSKNEKRQVATAETTVRLAENDESTDKGTLDLVYADNVLLDILYQDPIWKQRFDEYKTKYGTNATQFFKDMTRNFNEDFHSYYQKTHIVPATKDPVVNTLQKVQDKVTPAPA